MKSTMFYVIIFFVTLSAHEPCSCLSYLPLLYVISAAVCLLGVLVITIASVYYVSITFCFILATDFLLLLRTDNAVTRTNH